MRRHLLIAVLGLAFTSLASTPAKASDDLIEGAKMCTRHLPRFEREYAIPTHLLSAIASTESGRYHAGLKLRLPWPWTINANGKGYWLDSKEEAMALVKKLRKQGIQSMDVGCMQVNLLHHPDAFASLDQAFDPEKNIAYAASFLSTLYQEGNSWKKAAANYHSRTASRGTQYVGIVYDSWYNIIDKLRTARVQVPEASTLTAMKEMQSDTPKQALPKAKLASAKPKQALPEKKLANAAYTAPRIRSISVTNAAEKKSVESPMMVLSSDVSSNASLKPSATATAPAVPTVIQATPVTREREVAQISEPQIIRIDHRSSIVPVATAIPATLRSKGPNFIFSN